MICGGHDTTLTNTFTESRSANGNAKHCRVCSDANSITGVGLGLGVDRISKHPNMVQSNHS